MKHVILIALVSACALDADLETDESEIIYCPDGDVCEPPPPALEKPDLVPVWSTPCKYIYRDAPSPHYELAFAVKNIGTAPSTIHTARVVFRKPYQDWTSAPLYFQMGALAPGQSDFGRVIDVPCWNYVPGCEIKITADYANPNTEENEINNTKTWLCRP